MKNKNNLVLVFPQGEIQSIYQHDIHFERGIQYVMDLAQIDFQVVFAANFVDYLSTAKPQLWIYTTTPSAQELKENTIENLYQIFYNKALNQQKRKISE